MGAILILTGLVMIAPEVRFHRIQTGGLGAWFFRAGGLFTILALAMVWVTGGPSDLGKVGVLVGGTCALSGLFVWNHERSQALHNGASRWNWPQSLTFQLVMAGAIILALAVPLW